MKKRSAALSAAASASARRAAPRRRSRARRRGEAARGDEDGERYLDGADGARDGAYAPDRVQPGEERTVRDEGLDSARFDRGELERAEEEDHGDETVAQDDGCPGVEALGGGSSGQARDRDAPADGSRYVCDGLGTSGEAHGRSPLTSSVRPARSSLRPHRPASAPCAFAISRERRAMRRPNDGGSTTRTSAPNPRIQLTISGQTRTLRRTWTRPARTNDSCDRCQRWLRTNVAQRGARLTSMLSTGYFSSTKMPKLSAKTRSGS